MIYNLKKILVSEKKSLVSDILRCSRFFTIEIFIITMQMKKRFTL